MSISFQAIRASLFASATAANFSGLRVRRRSSQGERAFLLLPFRKCLITAVAPTTRTLRKPSSPARVMTPNLMGWTAPVSGVEAP